MFKTFSYRGVAVQKLRNVAIIHPCIIWIVNGEKRLATNGKIELLTCGDGLFLSANRKIVFENIPHNGYFSSRQISFMSPPCEKHLKQSRENSQYSSGLEILRLDDDLIRILDLIYQAEKIITSEEVRKHWLNGVYSLLAEKGMLHVLFPYHKVQFHEKTYDLLESLPPEEHNIIRVCSQFGVSKATLIRRLRKSGTQFKHLVRQVRMNHALFLIQSENFQLEEVALRCGYQSVSRFEAYFEEQFGISAKAYMASLQNIEAEISTEQTAADLLVPG
ncbi:helix-turn-helix transcriptional regulator [Vibrio scophthalmi]|uniref:HTH-type transcriptional regulator, AraC family protein n=1 Tax=Vibrio scophthalmi LMG 19158 TaxID=870967 RepID=F9RNS3_9VIBR|nr:helix-turn-helix transcriptional regulator [Vibrio scophthalmi]EGU36750.1 HTH-type transcriptional regulator, AraC family protein [Vibrio scophthalmi LMG 19158]